MSGQSDVLLITLNRLATYDALIKEYITNNVPTIDDSQSSEDKTWSSSNINNKLTTLSNALINKSDNGHTHDDRYYTETEVDNKLDKKSNTGHKHSKSEITDFPSSLPASDVYEWAKAATKPNYTAAEVGAIGYKGNLKELGYTKLSDVTEPGTYFIYDSNAFLTDWPDELTNDGLIYGTLMVHPAGNYITKTLIACNSSISTVRPVYFFKLDDINTYKIGTIKDDISNYLPLSGGTIIPENSDLNNYTTVGMYYMSYNSGAETIKNCPTTKAFTLYVKTSTGGPVSSLTDKYQYFIQCVQDIDGNTYQRTINSNTSIDDVVYGEWAKISTNKDLTIKLGEDYGVYDLNTLCNPGFRVYKISGASTNSPASGMYGHLLVMQANSESTWAVQLLVTEQPDNGIWKRFQAGGTWSNWVRYIASDNVSKENLVNADTTPTLNGQINWTYS